MSARGMGALTVWCVIFLFLFALGCSDSGSQGEPDGDLDSAGSDGDTAFCPPGEDCTPCESDDDCPDGYICSPTSDICIPDPDGDQIDGDDPDGDQADGDHEQAESDDTDGRRLEVIPQNVNFGSVQWGRTSTKDVIIRNAAAATADLTVTSVQFLNEGLLDFTFITLADDMVEEITPPVVLAPDESFVLRITYAPYDELDDDGEQILVTSDDNEAPIVRVDLTPQYKGEANLAIEPSPIEFGEVPVYTTAKIMLQVKNQPADPDGNRVLKISGLSLQNGQLVDGGFVLTPPQTINEQQPVFLIPGQAIEVGLEFAPRSMGNYSNILYVETNDPDQGPMMSFAITGLGSQADLAVTPFPIDFGAQIVDQTHTLDVQILNVGNDEFPIDGIALFDSNPEFAVVSADPALPWVLAPDEGGQVTLSFTPTAIPETTDRLWIQGGQMEGEDPKPDYFVEVLGSGKQALIRLEPEEIDFGVVQNMETAVESVRVFNDGTDDLVISSIEMDPVGSADFGYTEAADIYEPIFPGQSRYIDFTYAFDEGGNRSAADIFSNAGNSEEDGSVRLMMEATSSNPIFFMQPEEIDFVPVELNDRSVEHVTLKNIGNGSLTIFSVNIDIGSSPYFGVENFEKAGATVTLPVELEQSQTMTFDAVYEPLGGGQAIGAISITHNDYDLFQPGDSDRTEAFILLNADGPINHPPVAEIQANGSTFDISAPVDSLVLLDDDQVYNDTTGSYESDPDDTIVEWEYAIDSAPAGHGDLVLADSSATVVVNMPGDWIFSLRVKDSHDLWSVKDTIRVSAVTRPVAILKVNGQLPADMVNPKAGAETLLDLLDSYDPDGGNIQNWQFEVVSAPPFGDTTLNANGASAVNRPNKVGSWTYRGRVMDDEAVWSDWASVVVPVEKPETLSIFLDGINVCLGGFLGYDLIFTNPEDEVCGPPDVAQYACDWGPIHSGRCEGIGGNDNGSLIIWDYADQQDDYVEDLDGEYIIKVTAVGISSLFGEAVDVRLHKDGSDVEWWRGTHCYDNLIDVDWFIHLRRINGIWEAPYKCGPVNNCHQFCK